MGTESKTWPSLRRRHTTVKGREYTYWIVDCGLVGGKRRTKQFKDEAEAERYAEEQRILRRRYGRLAHRLSEEERLDAAHALEILGGRATLVEAAKLCVKMSQRETEARLLSDVIEEYLEEARRDNLRPRSIMDLRNRLGRLSKSFPERLVSGFTRHEIEEWIGSLKDKTGRLLSEMSRRHYRTVASGLFNFAVEKEYISENPLASKSRRRQRNGGLRDEKLPGILTVEQVKGVLREAEKHVPSVVPALAIGFFAGLRTSELCQLDWKDVDLESALITVVPTIAKGRYIRHVDIADNLAAWLRPHRKKSGFVAPQGTAWQYQFGKARELAKLVEWPHNAMRHSFASYYLAFHQDQNKTALQLGHRNTDLLYSHYRNLVPRKDATLYWSVQPSRRTRDS